MRRTKEAFDFLDVFESFQDIKIWSCDVKQFVLSKIWRQSRRVLESGVVAAVPVFRRTGVRTPGRGRLQGGNCETP